MYLAAKFQKVKLPTEKGNVWWLEFDISPKQLEGMLVYIALSQNYEHRDP
jgi:cyclin T